jgi:hypothetical protein
VTGSTPPFRLCHRGRPNRLGPSLLSLLLMMLSRCQCGNSTSLPLPIRNVWSGVTNTLKKQAGTNQRGCRPSEAVGVGHASQL